MTEPLDFRILSRLRDAIAAIDPARGYFGHVEDVAAKLDPDHDPASLEGVFPIVVIEPLPGESWEWEPADQAICIVPVRLTWIERVEPSADEPPTAASDDDRQRVYWRARTDMIKAVIVDDRFLGGLAVDTRVVSSRWNREAYDGQTVAAELELAIRTRRDFTRAGGY